MAKTIILKKSSVADKVPLSTDLATGEPAFNLVDKKLFTKDGNDNIIEIGNDKMVWKNEWGPGTYNKNEVVRDNNWTMIANKETSDRPSPQASGITERDTENVSFNIVSHDSRIRFVHHYTFSQIGWFDYVFIKTPTVGSNITTKIIITNTTNGDKIVIDNPSMVSDVWNTVYSGFYKISENDILKIEYEVSKTTYSSSNFSGEWTVDESSSSPGGAVVNFDSLSSPTNIKFSHTAWDGNKQTELESISINDIIFINDKNNTDNYLEVKVTNTIHNQNDVEFNVSVIGGGGTITANSRIIAEFHGASISLSYFEKTNYRPSGNPDWATVTSDLFYDNVNQNVTDSAFGIDIGFQKASISDDWDLVAYSSNNSSGSSSVNDVFGEYFTNFSAGDDSIQLQHIGEEDSLRVYRNGIREMQGIDYTYANTTGIITFTELFESTDTIVVDYQYK